MRGIHYNLICPLLHETNHLTLISREHEVDLPMLSKADAADALLTELFSLAPLPASTEGE